MSNSLDLHALNKVADRARTTFGEIVYFDIGARDGLSTSWSYLAKSGRIDAYGCDPANDHVQELVQRQDGVTYFPIALGESVGKKTLIKTFMPGCSSFLEPNAELLRIYPASRIFEVVGSAEVETDTLDNLVAQRRLPSPHILKLDTQGFELPILMSGCRVLTSVICIEIEVQFKPLYLGQALFPQVKEFLDGMGFILRHLEVNGPYEGEFLEANAYFSRRPKLDTTLELIRLWQMACDIPSPKFLSQMDDWLPEWKTYLTSEQMELRRRLFGPID